MFVRRLASGSLDSNAAFSAYTRDVARECGAEQWRKSSGGEILITKALFRCVHSEKANFQLSFYRHQHNCLYDKRRDLSRAALSFRWKHFQGLTFLSLLFAIQITHAGVLLFRTGLRSEL